ncbi:MULTISPECIES: signal peptidase I [unclassified Bacillus (in: firmicutes)]|uniref:signal peptidase I n=1 Tax=unclassified Bacillus (in: firmicutes) TaxID=185979 RepID=UPI0008E97AB9|nr:MULTISPECIES: signal peptidase I [unclassified Bacillus (in: firmicutes)]SFA92326.1 Signal peptidase I Serine peptidase. MEROPS family S26B [Bacillus sp. UNCCL13]SFQ85882.1 Signal peptidase I Serine peptidase. MEROPS family S26B [Bacillus sp. cl95]
MKKGIKIVSTTFLICVGLLVLTMVYYFFQSKGNVEKIPSVFGYKPLSILSNSMQPKFNAGDVIIINVNDEAVVNDVITYKHPDGILVTHRIIDSIEKDGKLFFKTKGDNNNVDDGILVGKSDIVGVQVFVIPNGGYVAKFVAGPIGFVLLILIPLLAFLIIEIFERTGILNREKHVNN